MHVYRCLSDQHFVPRTVCTVATSNGSIRPSLELTCTMTSLIHLLNSLGSAGVRSGVLSRLLGPSCAQQMAALTSAAVGRLHTASAADARVPKQVACFSTSSWLQTEHTFKSAEAKEQALQQLMVEILPQLEPLGVTPQLLQKVLVCQSRQAIRQSALMMASTAHQLKDRFNNIHQLAAANTTEQRTLVNKQLSHTPQLLTRQASQVAANASELRNILCQQFNVSPVILQQLITKQLSVLTCKPQSVAEKLQGWASTLQLDVASVVQDVWCKHTGTEIVRSSKASVAAAVQQLQSVLHLGAGDVLHLALTVPSALATVSENKLRVRSQLLGSYGWTQKQLGQAVMKYPIVFTNSIDSINLKWTVFHQYAAAHPPSQQQLQDKCKDSVMLIIFKTSIARLQLMQYIMQYLEQPEQQWDGRAVSSSASDTKCLQEQSGQHRRRRKKSKFGSRDSSATTSVTSVAGPPFPRRERPLVWCFTKGGKDSLVKLAVDNPGFWEWLKQQQG